MKVKCDHRKKKTKKKNKKKQTKKKFTAMITFHFHLQPQYKYELFHIKLHRENDQSDLGI